MTSKGLFWQVGDRVQLKDDEFQCGVIHWVPDNPSWFYMVQWDGGIIEQVHGLALVEEA